MSLKVPENFVEVNPEYDPLSSEDEFYLLQVPKGLKDITMMIKRKEGLALGPEICGILKVRDTPETKLKPRFVPLGPGIQLKQAPSRKKRKAQQAKLEARDIRSQVDCQNVSSPRLEHKGSKTIAQTKSFEKKVFAKDCVYMYGGHTYIPNSSQKANKIEITKKSLPSTTTDNKTSKDSMMLSMKEKLSGKKDKAYGLHKASSQGLVTESDSLKDVKQRSLEMSYRTTRQADRTMIVTESELSPTLGFPPSAPQTLNSNGFSSSSPPDRGWGGDQQQESLNESDGESSNSTTGQNQAPAQDPKKQRLKNHFH